VDWPLVRLLEEADASARDLTTRASLQSRLAIELYWHQGGGPSRQRSLAALAAAEASGSTAALTVALHARQFTLRSPDHLDERIAIGERLTGLAASAGNTDLSFQGAVWLAADVLRRGDLLRFRSLAAALEVLAARSQRPLWRWYATVMRAQLAAPWKAASTTPSRRPRQPAPWAASSASRSPLPTASGSSASFIASGTAWRPCSRRSRG